MVRLEQMQPRRSDPLSYVRDWRERLLQGGWWHSFELPDGTRIQGVSDLDAQKIRLAQFPIPQDLSGKRVLDIGAWDGWFSFEMERRGAEVVAIDRFDNPRFREMRARLGSRVEYRQVDVYDVSPSALGYFDVVLFLGVLYHLRHPLLALERVCSVTRDMAAVESFVLQQQHGIPAELEATNLIRFFEDDDFGGQVDNWCAPTTAALQALCRSAGFARADLLNLHEFGAAVMCYRKWDQSPTEVPLLAVVNSETFGINFNSAREEYVTCLVEPGVEISRDTVFPQVDGWGVRPLFAGATEGGYNMVHFKLPPGLAPGWHEVRVFGGASLLASPAREARRIAVDLEATAVDLEITGVCDGVTWQQDSITSGYLSLWIRGLPENADVHNVEVYIDDARTTLNYLGPQIDDVRQINARTGADPGEIQVVFGAANVRRRVK